MYPMQTKILLLLLLTLSTQVQAKPIKHNLQGIGSWYTYQKGNHSHKTASGEIFNPRKLTAAHKTLPFGTKVKVTNKDNNKSVVVTITDRGPFKKGRVIDLSKSAAKAIDITGIQKVSLKIMS